MATVAIVDDERDICDLLRILFEARGHRTVPFHDGRKALEWFATGKPDIVLLDISLPGMNGYEVLDALKSQPLTAKLPVILITALTKKSGKSDEDWMRAAGADGFLSKPFDPFELLEYVERILSGGGVRAAG